MRKAILFFVVSVFVYGFGPERLITGLVEGAIEIYHGRLPGQLTDIETLANIATILAFLLALWIFTRPSRPASGDHPPTPLP